MNFVGLFLKAASVSAQEEVITDFLSVVEDVIIEDDEVIILEEVEEVEERDLGKKKHGGPNMPTSVSKKAYIPAPVQKKTPPPVQKKSPPPKKASYVATSHSKKKKKGGHVRGGHH